MGGGTVTDNEELDNQNDALIEEYLLFLRGLGPQPDLSDLPSSRREVITGQFEIVRALADRDPELPPIEQDPVARRLGLVADASSAPLLMAAQSTPRASGGVADEPLKDSLEELAFRFRGRISTEFHPAWSPEVPQGMRAIAQCAVLAEAVAVLVGDTDTWSSAPEELGRFFNLYADISAICVTSADAERAVVLSPADVTRSISPVLGWLDPHSSMLPEPLGLALGRFFERRLPRWDRVADFDVLPDTAAVDAVAREVTEAQIAQALRAKPRLEYKKEGQLALGNLDAAELAALVVSVQTGGLMPDDFVDRLAEMAGAAAS
ncbi:hypothetical protein M2283_002585 [Streptomyces pseudovenezuelae]|uniref:Uncharacterized protein n=1 Tax=Streptomyces pseudovenezuelae TaxID=67350 RepID=A0ABT6LG52_9ACTN|nr:hypothetical protein [Streptomyces pseudovenezuelae]